MIKLVPKDTNFHKYLESLMKIDNDDQFQLMHSLH